LDTKMVKAGIDQYGIHNEYQPHDDHDPECFLGYKAFNHL